MELTILAAIKAVNDGLLLWQAVGPLIQQALENGQGTVTLDDVKAAQTEAAAALGGLEEAIKRAQAEGR